jgi:hypothetical protein
VPGLRTRIDRLARRVRGALKPPAIDWIFMSAGGSGSSFLNDSLRSFGVRVAERPDVMLRPAEIADLRSPATLPVRTMFTRRANGFAMDGTRSIEANLLDYLRFLDERPRHTALFSNVPHFGFFSRNRVRGVALLVRHPLQAYVSFAKPERHLDLVLEWGGLYSESSLRRYADYWLGFVREYVAPKEAGLQPGLLRYERLLEDARALGLERFFPEWRPSRNPVGDANAAALLRSIVEREYLEIYPSWDV